MSRLKSQQSLFDSAIECANNFNWVVAECSVTGGLIDYLSYYRSIEEIIKNMNFLYEKKDQLLSMLNILIDIGLVESKVYGGQKVYRSIPGFVDANKSVDNVLNQFQAKNDLLKPWFSNADHYSQMLRASNQSLLGRNLSYFRSESVKIRFDNSCLDSWKINLSNPLYEYGRIVAVNELVKKGTKFLDLASGLGYGAQRISEFSETDCEIVCIDRSKDFLTEAQLLIYPNAKVKFIERDLNNGLPELLPSGYFDGILFNGAFHFIQDKKKMLREMNKVLRVGGMLVIGHCFSKSGFEDESMHDFYFAMIENPSWVVEWDQVCAIVEETGYIKVNEYHRGSHSYLIAEKYAEAGSSEVYA